MRCFVTQEIDKSRQVIEKMLFSEQILSTLETIAEVCVDALYNGGRVLFCGDAGRAADCQLLAGELVERLGDDRNEVPSIALAGNTQPAAATAQRCGRDHRLARNVATTGRDGDVLIGISVDGQSAAMLEAMHAARQAGIATVGLTGSGGVAMAACCDHLIMIPSHDAARIQEGHLVLGHVLCGLIARTMYTEDEQLHLETCHA